jgi:hypothetical protein
VTMEGQGKGKVGAVRWVPLMVAPVRARGRGSLKGDATLPLMVNAMAGLSGGGGAREGPAPDRAPSYRPEWQGILRPKSLAMDWLWKVFG